MAGPTQLVEIERILSGERFRRYKAAARDDIALAIELYQINIEVSECVFGVLHLAEVCIRNSMHSALANYIGTPEWFRIGTVLPRTRKPIPYTAPMRDMVSQAVSDQQGMQPHPERSWRSLPLDSGRTCYRASSSSRCGFLASTKPSQTLEGTQGFFIDEWNLCSVCGTGSHIMSGC